MILRITKATPAAIRWGNSEIQKVAQEGARNHGLLNIGVEDFFNIELRIPEKAEQEKIADFLSAVDQKIDLENQKLENLEKYKKSITQQILTQKLRFSEFTGLINMKKIKDCKGITVKKGRALSSSDLVSGNYPVVAGGKTSPYSHNDYTNENAVTISASGAYAGYISYHKGRFWASDCSVVECDHNYNDMVFVYNALLINQGDIYSCQTGGAQPHVYPDNIKNIRIWLPELDEQQKIAGFLSSIDEKTDLQKTKLDHLKTFKKSLLQRMFV
ncbi:restriction endonuclease subunit S [Candidatus Saccharibacteria bacterium]|nr:MAG: restriction endonuclease subunit S [Candidatus Saccharibacteria bacterium]